MSEPNYKVIGYRYGKEMEYDRFKTLDAAVSFCNYSVDENEMFPTKVICPDGTELTRYYSRQDCMAHGPLQDLMDKYHDEEDEED